MKRVLLAAIIFCVPVVASAQFGMTMNYTFSAPQGMMAKSLNNAHGFGMDYYYAPKRLPISVGLTFAYNAYGLHTRDFVFNATDGSQINTTLSVTNSFINTGLYLRYAFAPAEARLIPYADVRAGGAFYNTNLVIADPADTDNCRPLVNDLLQKDKALTGYVGGGLDVRLTNLDKTCGNSISYLFVSAGIHMGGPVSYMNVDKDLDPNAHPQQTNTPHNHGAGESKNGRDPIYADFINTQTQVVHTHHVGYVYTAPIQLLECKVGLRILFTGDCKFR